ncbi:MAG: glycosyltransferase family 39 protein [Ignavibacteriales bacterium]|nr:glycosyltransferase family 39 protein [Ignavibacteriales bacterium]
MEIKLIHKITLAAIGFIGTCAVILLTSNFGAGVSPDSVAYISAARNLAEGHGFLTYNGLYLVVQPPLYPILLAVIKKITLLDPLISAGYVNAVLFGLIIYLSGLLLVRYLKSFTLIILGTVSVLISFALVQSSLMALSELLFIFLVLLFLYSFGTYQKKGNSFSFFLFSVSVALSCLTRYTGVVLILTGLICILLLNKNNVIEKFWNSLIFLIITVAPISIWIIRNILISGTLVGQRAESSYTLFDNIKFFYSTVLHWYLPLNSTNIYLTFIILITAVWFFFGLDRSRSSFAELFNQIGPILLFVSLYVGVIVISSTTTAYDRISDRLLSPIFIPIILISFFVFDRIRIWLITFFSSKLITVLFVIGIVWLIKSPAENTLHIIDEYITFSGWGYNCESWKKSETVEFLNQHKSLWKNFAFYSNEPEAVYILTNLNTERSPAKTFYNSPQLFNVSADQNEIWKNEKNACLIWFNKTNRSFLFTIDELQKKINMKEVAQLKDGEIYTILGK